MASKKSIRAKQVPATGSILNQATTVLGDRLKGRLGQKAKSRNSMGMGNY